MAEDRRGPLADLQAGFAAHLRDPEHAPPPADVEPRRMAIYRDLFFRNISGFIARSFPVLRRLHEDEAWDALIRDFYRQHRCHTPLFPEIPREFLQFLQDREQGRRAAGREPEPWLLQLAHYEWVEIALDLDPTELDEIPVRGDGDLLTEPPVLSPLAWLLSYDYPVHRIRPGETPPAIEVTHLLVYRDRADRVRFMQLNPLSARVLGLLKEDPSRTGLEVLSAVADELGKETSESLLPAGRRLFEDLRQRDVILGVRA